MTTVELYRCYDKDEQLLYVGVSSNIVERLRRHSHRSREGKVWWPDVASVALERFPHMADALTAEVRAIRTEQPRYNKRSAVAA